jgi:hypothetical protein
MNLEIAIAVAVTVAVFVCAIRIAVRPNDSLAFKLFKTFAHIFVGWLIGMDFCTHTPAFVLILGAISLVELACFLLSRARIDNPQT